MDGILKLAGWEPLPSDLDPTPDLELPPPALQICGFKDGLVTAPAEYHKPQTSAHLADEFAMVRQRWLGFSKAQEHIAQRPVKRRRSQEESSPAARGSAQDAAVGSSESQAHLLNVKYDYVGEGII